MKSMKMRGLLKRTKIASKQGELKNTQPRNLEAWQSSFQIHSPQLLLPGQFSNTRHKKLLFKKLLGQENAGLIPCLGTILATETGCCKQRLWAIMHTCHYLLLGFLVSPRTAFKFLHETFLVHTQSSCHTARCARQKTRWLFVGVSWFPSSSDSGTEATYLRQILGENLALKHPGSNSYCHSVTHLARVTPAGRRYMPAV